jgi:DNA-binding LacI/PurR family transcriptional regulator
MSAPSYLEIYNDISSNISGKKIKEDEKIPSVREMARKKNVSKATVSRAYDMLIREGFARSEKGKGMFACSPEEVKVLPAGLFLQYTNLSTVIKYAQDFLLGVQESFEAGSIPLLICNHWRNGPLKASQFADLQGAILFERFNIEEILSLRDLNIPIVVAEIDMSRSGFDTIISDHLEGITTLVKKLYDTGCRNMLFAHPDRKQRKLKHWDPAYQIRFDGFKASMNMLGLKPEDYLIPIDRPKDKGDDGQVIADYIMHRDTLPDAVITNSSGAAESLIHTLESKQVKVPDQVSVASFGTDNPDEEDPLVSSITFDFKTLGRKTVEMLISRKEDLDAPARLEYLPPIFIQGRSTRL